MTQNPSSTYSDSAAGTDQRALPFAVDAEGTYVQISQRCGESATTHGQDTSAWAEAGAPDEQGADHGRR